MQLPTNIKMVSAIKLMGYSMQHKRLAGAHHQHEFKDDDWLAIRVKEVRTGKTLMSNNQHADGALHVIHSGGGTDSSVELYCYEPLGLACATFSAVNMPSLTVEVVDQQGREAHVGRLHIWLRILVDCP